MGQQFYNVVGHLRTMFLNFALRYDSVNMTRRCGAQGFGCLFFPGQLKKLRNNGVLFIAHSCK